ncbi:hypothetical protein TNCV_1683631 [Trichonephila clavipes]|nr:hypothetical protein TNCV_1683631 [Trichonephila clavipes]
MDLSELRLQDLLRTERTPIFEEGVLCAVDRNSGTGCISQCAVSTERSRTTVHRGTDYSQIIINDVPRLRIGLLTKVRQTCQSMSRRCYACIHANGHNFEHL